MQNLALKEVALGIVFVIFAFVSYGIAVSFVAPYWQIGAAIAVEWLFYVGIVKFAYSDEDF